MFISLYGVISMQICPLNPKMMGRHYEKDALRHYDALLIVTPLWAQDHAIVRQGVNFRNSTHDFRIQREILIKNGYSKENKHWTTTLAHFTTIVTGLKSK